MTETAHTPLPCPNPWCASHQTTDPQIRAFHAPIVVPRGKLYQVACPVCPVQTPLYATEAEALTAWNTRADSLHRLVEALEQIGELTKRRQLPLTHEINDIVLAALKEAGRG